MAEPIDDEGLRTRLTRQGEEAIGKLAQDLLENPLINGALTRAFEAQKKASQAQEVAMGALNLPSAADLERLTRRVRSVSQRLEGIEDSVDRLDVRLESLLATAQALGRIEEQLAGSTAPAEDERLARMELQLGALTRELAALREALPLGAEPIPAAQERLQVGTPRGRG